MGFVVQNDLNDKLVSLKQDGNSVYISVGDDCIGEFDGINSRFDLYGWCTQENTGLEVNEKGEVLVFSCGKAINASVPKKTKK